MIHSTLTPAIDIVKLDISTLDMSQRIKAANEFKRSLYRFENAATRIGNFKFSEVSQINVIIDTSSSECIIHFGVLEIDTWPHSSTNGYNDSKLTMEELVAQLIQDKKLHDELKEKYDGKSIYSFPEILQNLTFNI